VREAWERLSNLNSALDELQKLLVEDAKSRAEINNNIRDVAANMRDHRNLAQSELDSRTTILEQQA
jgi:hypothetical protein